MSAASPADQEPDLYLASASPRRRTLLAQLGLRIAVIPAPADETPHGGEAPADYVLRIALAKARAGRAAAAHSRGRPLLAADTAVVVDGRALGKPADRDEALAMLALLSGRSHRVLTGVALLAPDDQAQRTLSTTEVRMGRIAPAQARAYWDTGEPADKAGAYAIQGLGAMFVEHIRGSYSGVVGLPLFETAALLGGVGLALPARG